MTENKVLDPDLFDVDLDPVFFLDVFLDLGF
jgi:hypothetical protein